MSIKKKKIFLKGIISFSKTTCCEHWGFYSGSVSGSGSGSRSGLGLYITDVLHTHVHHHLFSTLSVGTYNALQRHSN